ncbi:hypothetical protein D6783_00975 [Candidatus Woesearchaeota archaeon]|nr:MAG: hypothetical protein D6783_00975 [Candidatus Woesearchaeota archaeon]
MNVALNKCSLCGLCNKDSVLFQAVGRESVAPRFAAFLLLQGKEDAALFRYVLDGSAKKACPAGVDLDAFVIRGRNKLVERGVETKANRRMISAARLYGTPYVEEE